MTLALYAHPFSSYCQKVLIALYERDVPFDYRVLGPDHPANYANFAATWPIKKMPLLIDGDQAVAESSVIIERLDRHFSGRSPMLPGDPDAASEVRFLDRVFDNYIMTPMQKIVADARSLLDATYAWLDGRLRDREWASGGDFSLADCAAAPSLFYADWVNEIPVSRAALKAYRARLLKRPSVARAVDEARPFRTLFPPGAPDRD